MAGTLNWADAYGEPAGVLQMAAPISAAGPNQSYVAPAFSNPGTYAPVGNAPTLSLMALVAGLVLLRVAIELSDRA